MKEKQSTFFVSVEFGYYGGQSGTHKNCFLLKAVDKQTAEEMIEKYIQKVLPFDTKIDYHATSIEELIEEEVTVFEKYLEYYTLSI